MRTLLALFQGDFPKTGRISVHEEACPVILRSCAFLRLQLRHGALAAHSDATLEAEPDPGHYTGEERDIVTYYEFLATLQIALLQNITVPMTLQNGRVRDFESFSSRIRSLFQRESQATDAWQVVIRNDPVNLMSYVVAVLRSVLDLSETDAQQHMRQVHESKSSVVWVGSHAKAEARVRALQAWHLKVDLKSGKEAP